MNTDGFKYLYIDLCFFILFSLTISILKLRIEKHYLNVWILQQIDLTIVQLGIYTEYIIFCLITKNHVSHLSVSLRGLSKTPEKLCLLF